ncbi:MAG: ATP-dependent Clp protease adaptor ClpS [Planctomycetota bacterium]|nr:MAG: ATP-dependent Clp protease adaptor ClpS [Planctomycetota bacterium]
MTETITTPAERTQTQAEPRSDRAWLWNVVLLDDDEHTYEYVIRMLHTLFGMPVERAFRLAEEVDARGRAVVLTTHKEHAELKRDQVHAFGKDALIASCAGSMSAVLEPAECGSDDED